MKFLFIILGISPTTAFAIGLDEIGGRNATGMWRDVCSTLPYCGDGSGANGVAIITGIVINTVLWAIGSAAVVIILYAAIRLITSAGNDETIRKAWKEMIFYAALGLIFAVLADVIVNYVISLVGGIAAG